MYRQDNIDIYNLYIYANNDYDKVDIHSRINNAARIVQISSSSLLSSNLINCCISIVV